MFTAELRGGFRVTGQQGTQTHIHALDIVVRNGVIEYCVHVIEHVLNICGGGRRMCLVVVPVGVGGANDPVASPGNNKEHRLLGAQQESHDRLEAITRNHNVDPLRCPHAQRAAIVDKLLGGSSPHSGGVNDLLGADGEFTSGFQVAHGDADDLTLLLQEANDFGAVRRVSAVGDRRANQVHHVAGVIDAAVVVAHATDDPGGLETWCGQTNLALAQVTVVSDAGATATGIRKDVIEQHARTHIGAFPDGVLHGVEKTYGLHQVGSQLLQQQPTLGERFLHQVEVELLEVANTAVNQLGRAAGGSGSPVLCFDHTDVQTARSRIQSTARAHDAATNDKNVEFFCRHGSQRFSTRVCIEHTLSRELGRSGVSHD